MLQDPAAVEAVAAVVLQVVRFDAAVALAAFCCHLRRYMLRLM